MTMVNATRLCAVLASLAASTSCASGAESRDLESVVVVFSIATMSLALVAVMASLVWYTFSRAPHGSAIESSSWQVAFFSATIALFGVLMAGLFVFMSFRVDTGARQAAEAEARSVAAETAESVAANAAQRSISDGLKPVQEIAAQIAQGSSRLRPDDDVTELSVGERVELEVDGQDRVWAVFTTAEEQDYGFDVVDGDDDLFVDPIAYLYVEQDTGEDAVSLVRLIAENDDGGKDFDARLVRRLEANKDYYLGIATFGETRGVVEVLVSPAGG